MRRPSLGRTVLAFASLLGLMAIFSASALAAGPPIVTVSAPEKTLHTALMQGTVDANGGTGTTWKFEYGQSKLYGNTTTKTNLKSGTGAIPVNWLLYGLEPGITWHYRISATNSLGTTVSEDMQFETLLTWRVEGKPVSEAQVPEWPEYGNEVSFGTETVTTFTAEAKIAGINTKVLCETAPGKGYVGNKLGYNYKFEFTTCKTFLNGTESKACAPTTPQVISLNGVMVPAEGTQIKMSAECAIGTKISLNGSGFTVGALAEAKVVPVTLTEHLPTYGGAGLNLAISNPGWFLTGPWVGMKFGIS